MLCQDSNGHIRRDGRSCIVEYKPQVVRCTAMPGRMYVVVGDVVETRDGGREGRVHLRLVLSFRRQKPCCNAEGDDYYEANEGCPAVAVSFLVQASLTAQTDPFAIVYVEARDDC
jgi:hypothetical protein